MNRTELRVLQGWRLTGVLTLGVVVMSTALAGSHGFDVEGVRLVIRATARTSFAFFALAYGASALVALWPGALTRWLRANRRYVGVGFAGSHAMHAVAIAAFGYLDRAEFMQQTMVANFAFGGLAYVFIVAMTVTSFNRSAAWLGTKGWGRLHAIGGFYIWVTFFVSGAKRAIYNPSYWVYVAVLVAILGVKLAARIRAAPARNSAAGAR